MKVAHASFEARFKNTSAITKLPVFVQYYAQNLITCIAWVEAIILLKNGMGV